MLKTKVLLIFLFFTFFCEVDAQLRTSPIFSDHMVLQQNAAVPIWGWCWPGLEITITNSWNNDEVKVKTSGRGEWKAVITTPSAGGPHTLTLKSPWEELTFNDVLIGEVWFCSGQSNMEWTMDGATDGKEEYPQANFPDIRLFTVLKAASDYPQVHVDGNWKTGTPDNVRWFSAVAYFFGKRIHQQLNVPVGLINSSWGGTPAEVWTPDSLVFRDEELKASAKKLKRDPRWPTDPGVLFNAMVYPVMPYSIAGAIWYQGESNTAAPLTYKKLMEQLVSSWRKGFKKEFPFYYVQIAPFKGYGDVETGTLIREQEVEMLKIPKTGMVVIADHVENVNDIHPKFKKPVGERLANYALGDLYEVKGIAYKTPLFKSMGVEKNQIRIHFENVPNGLISKGDEITEFIIAGEDQKFVPAKAKIEGNSVIVYAREIKNPVAVRYAWSNGSVGNLFSKEGLPVSCFRTDNWTVIK